ncbi:MAG: FAD-dependent oxidoreductase [Dehalococcoidia bacterium]
MSERGDVVMENIDVLVIGGGIGGVFAAIRAKQAGADRVVQVDKARVGKSGASCFAAGVMHVMFPTNDSLEDRVRRAVRTSGYLAQQGLIEDHFEQSWPITLEMEKYGVKFLKTPEGEIQRQQARGSHPVVMFGGPQLMDALSKAALKMGIARVNRVMITDLLTHEGRVVGAVGFHTRTGEFHVFKARATVLATGSTRFKGSIMEGDRTGDGFAAAFRAGAILMGAEAHEGLTNAMLARHPIGPGMNMYVGEGARFINAKGERFMELYNPTLKERSGLRFIAYAFSMEVRRGNAPIYNDMTHFAPEQVRKLKTVLPLAMRMYERIGIVEGDRFVNPIEWALVPDKGRPGPAVNRNFETSLPGLYAVGEAAASQAVITGISAAATSGAVAGEAAASYAREIAPSGVDQDQVQQLREYALAPLHRDKGIEPSQIILSMQEAILPYDRCILRHGSRMNDALAKLEDIQKNELPLLMAYDPHYLRMAHEARNLLFTARIYMKSALMRTESRVALREDYPEQDDINWLKWIKVARDGDDMKLTTEDVPIDTYAIRPERKKELHSMWKMALQRGIITLEGGQVRWA